MSLLSVDIPFIQLDADAKNVTTTGGAISALFTGLDYTKCRQVIIYNAGASNLLLGKDTAGAKFPILPGAAITLSAKDLSKLFVKGESGTLAIKVLAIY